MKIKRLVIAGGHLGPALAFIEIIKSHPDWEVHFIGRKYGNESSSEPSLESTLIPKMKIPFYPIDPARVQRRMTWTGLKSLLKFPQGLIQCHKLISSLKPDAALSFGGYVGFYVSIAAFIHHVPVVIHEQTTIPGLANLASSLIASKIAVSWPGTRFFNKKTYLTGNLIKPELIHFDSKTNLQYILKKHMPTIMFVGGHQGSQALNQVVTPKLLDYLQYANVVFQTGSLNLNHDYENAINTVSKSKTRGKWYIQKFFYPDEYAAVLHLSDLVVGRAGANTVTDVAAIGKPAIFIPLPHSSGGEQFKNAQILLAFGSQIIDQSILTADSLYLAIKQTIGKLDQIKKLAQGSTKLVNFQSAEGLLKLLESAVS